MTSQSPRSLTYLYSDLARSGPPLFFPDPEVPVVFNFDQGLAAPETFPREDLVRIARMVLERDGPAPLDYFDPDTGYEELVYGYRKLRESIANRIAERQGPTLTADGVILTSGSVQGIALATSGLLDAGDVVFVESASFPYALRYMTMAGAEVRPVPIDEHGMDVDALGELIAAAEAEGRRVKMVYTIATFQTPTNTVMSLPRRRRLIDLLRRHDFVVLEDNVYGELRFAGEALPTLLSLDDTGRVIQAGSFSKSIAPALRMGWMAGQPELIAALAAVRQDLGVSQWTARILDEYLRSALLDPHLERANAVYRAKAAVAVKAVREHCGEFVSFREPEGSFYLWLQINDSVDWDRASAEAVGEGIFFRPGERFSEDADDRRFLRLAYSHVSEDVIASGIARLGEILRRCRVTAGVATA